MLFKVTLLLYTIISLAIAQQAPTTCKCGPLRACLEEKKRDHLNKGNRCHNECKGRLHSDAAENCISSKKKELEQLLDSLGDCIFNPDNGFCASPSARSKRQADQTGGVGQVSGIGLPQVAKDYEDCFKGCIRDTAGNTTGDRIFAAIKECTDSLGCDIDRKAATAAFKSCSGKVPGFSPLRFREAKREICECLKNVLPADQTSNMQC